MKLVDKVKIGGMTYEVEQTEHLDNGSKYAGEIVYSDLKIRIRPQLKPLMHQTLIHEIIHGIFEFMQWDQDETHVEVLTNALYALIVDNPELFSNNEPKEESA